MKRNRLVKVTKQFIKRSDLLYALANVVWHRKTPGYLEHVNGYFSDPEIVLIRPGEEGQKQPICLIEAWDETNGFACGLRKALDGLYYCRRCSFKPLIRFHDNSWYKDKSFPQDMNPFEYYFESENISDDELKQRPQVIYQSRNGQLAEQMNQPERSYSFSKEYITAMAKIWGRDLKLRQDIQNSIDEFISEKGIRSDCLRVHFRGTDYKVGYYDHPVYVSIEEYYPYIEEAMRIYRFSKMYIATDDLDALHDLIKRFGNDKVIYDEKATRVRGADGVHTSVENGFKNGLDVLIDMSALATCGGLISGVSHVAQITRIIKRSFGSEYLYDKPIFKGIVEHGKMFDKRRTKPVNV